MKPVAWIQTWEGLEGGFKHTVNFEKIGDNDIPVYTAPKQLSDDEILELWTKKNNLNGAQDIVDFAKAILRKANALES
jgi:hypothetical protein